MKQILWLIALLVGIASAIAQQSPLRTEDVPTFQLRARVVSAGGEAKAQKKYTFRLRGLNAAAPLGEWSDWLKFERAQAEATLKDYPAMYARGFPVVVKLHVDGVVDPTHVEAELRVDETGEIVPSRAELFGPSFGFLLWRDDQKKPHAATMAEYNKRYWQVLASVKVPDAHRPKKFPIVERFIGGSDDRLEWREGIEQLSRAGFSVVMLPPSRPIRDLLHQAGGQRTAWAVYNPPGYAFDYDPKVTPESIEQWAQNEAKPYLAAGYAREDMAAFAMADETGWYYPQMFRELEKNPAAMTRFHDYLKAQKLKPDDLGAKKWEEIKPLGRSGAKDLPSRRLFYWTIRFFSWDSARHFAVCTRALERAFYPNMPIFTNWNFFAGRFYFPGPFAHNRDKQSPDSAMASHDWLEFGRLRGGTMLWTEDWFSDAQAYQWSFYCAKLRCGAERSDSHVSGGADSRGGGVQFGGYVIPRTAGDRADGILQKILCVVGSGGKCVKYFVFGPEYNFPGNCYSENVRVLPKMAEAHAIIGAAEDLLWPGKRPRPEVAILSPRSALPWDTLNTTREDIIDATNTNLNGSTVDYMAEVFNLYLALQHANIPVDFVDEDDLTAQGLKPYGVLYVTEPNVPAEGQRALVAWTRAGGTLVTVTGAAAYDRYNEPCRILSNATDIREQPRDRMLVPNLGAIKEVMKGNGKLGEFTVFGALGVLEKNKGKVHAEFANSTPAIVQRDLGRGRAIHFAWLPGLSYVKSQTGTKDKLPVCYSENIRRWIVYPTELAKITPPVTVDAAMIETPMLLSVRGAAITLLNWRGESESQLQVTARVPFTVRSVESVKRGALKFELTKTGCSFSLPLDAADVIMVRP